ncbi:MAG: asparaginase domain-containing protein [archaeon]
MDKDTIHFILTGGTIDSYLDGKKDAIVTLKKSFLPEYLNSLSLYIKFKFTELFMKDSRQITEADLKLIKKTIDGSEYKKIILTHGTYTMADTARYLKANLKRKDQVVVLMGSFLPLKEFPLSDGAFNLGFAIAKAQTLKPGVYIFMNGKEFEADEAAKLVSEGRFISVK